MNRLLLDGLLQVCFCPPSWALCNCLARYHSISLWWSLIIFLWVIVCASRSDLSDPLNWSVNVLNQVGCIVFLHCCGYKGIGCWLALVWTEWEICVSGSNLEAQRFVWVYVIVIRSMFHGSSQNPKDYMLNCRRCWSGFVVYMRVCGPSCFRLVC